MEGVVVDHHVVTHVGEPDGGWVCEGGHVCELERVG